ncbi:MAG: hypothetical protein WC365_09725 [Candidatus Babeliales bacterium]|jgi:hypothetical protein
MNSVAKKDIQINAVITTEKTVEQLFADFIDWVISRNESLKTSAAMIFDEESQLEIHGKESNVEVNEVQM